MIGKSIEELSLRDKAEFAKTVTESDIYLFAGLSGDYNPAHINEEYAKKTFFKTRIANGMLSAGFISEFISRLPLRSYILYLIGEIICSFVSKYNVLFAGLGYSLKNSLVLLSFTSVTTELTVIIIE